MQASEIHEIKQLVTKLTAEDIASQNEILKAFNTVLMYVFLVEARSVGSNSFALSKVLCTKCFDAYVDFFDGENVRAPTKREKEEIRALALAFYLKEFLNMNWNEIRDAVQKKYGDHIVVPRKKVVKIKQILQESMMSLLSKLDKTEVENYVR